MLQITSENIDTILWTFHGKVDMVDKDNRDTLDFTYDAMCNQIVKMVKPFYRLSLSPFV